MSIREDAIDTNKINYLNIGLMVMSAMFAYLYPFELFLFVYAFLGPLHYLTEISWLHDRRYYTRKKNDYLILVGMSIFITLINFGWFAKLPVKTTEFTIFLAFSVALIFALTNKRSSRIFWLVVSILVAGLMYQTETFTQVFGVLLPTLIHVFLFTGLFILVGALKGRSFSGLLSLAIFIVIGLSFLFFHPEHAGYQVTEYVRNSFGYLKDDGTGFTEGFALLNVRLLDFYQIHSFERSTVPFPEFVQSVNQYIYANPTALALMSFIAFAYTYHYLNWFSKTSIIQWHHIPKSRFVGVILLWTVSLSVYAYNYTLGLDWLFFLSFTHVMLELPLNHLTFIAVGREIRGLFAKKIGSPN